MIHYTSGLLRAGYRRHDLDRGRIKKTCPLRQAFMKKDDRQLTFDN